MGVEFQTVKSNRFSYFNRDDYSRAPKSGVLDGCIQLALADYEARTLRRRLRFQREVTSVLAIALAVALIWGAVG